jgi:hypothetical protein
MTRGDNTNMPYGLLGRYFKFLVSRKSVYLTFNKQLFIAELAGFVAGVLVAEAAASMTRDEVEISLYSSISDYVGSVLAFILIYYRDTVHLYKEDVFRIRFWKVLKSLKGLWLPVLSADIAFLIARPYIHYVMMQTGFDPGVAGGIAHFLAFGVFNVVAIFSRSMYEYVRGVK